MSVLVRELESQLGFRLFERTTRKVKLTEFGSKLLPVAIAACSTGGRGRQHRALRTAAKGSLTLGAGPFAAAELLPRAIAAYAQRDPHLPCASSMPRVRASSTWCAVGELTWQSSAASGMTRPAWSAHRSHASDWL